MEYSEINRTNKNIRFHKIQKNNQNNQQNNRIQTETIYIYSDKLAWVILLPIFLFHKMLLLLLFNKHFHLKIK